VSLVATVDPTAGAAADIGADIGADAGADAITGPLLSTGVDGGNGAAGILAEALEAVVIDRFGVGAKLFDVGLAGAAGGGGSVDAAPDATVKSPTTGR
jgi:hypothetical protein